MILKKIFSFVLICVFVSNAADGAVSRVASSSGIIMPIFYDDPVMRARDGAVQTPVNLEGPVDSNYIVGPGDFFEIILPNQQEVLQISPEGTVAVQGYGLVEISGLPLCEAKRKIFEKLKGRYDQRFIGVHLVQLRRFIVNVQGAVQNPGQVPVSGQVRVKGAIYSAGNFKPWANKDSVYIYRMGDTIATTENMLLQAGDIIMVPGKDWQQTIDISHSGKTITIPYVSRRTLKEYLQEAGINVENEYSEISVKYTQDGFTRFIGIDQIGSFVPEPLCEIEFHIKAPFVYVGGAVMAVGKVPYNSSMHAADYVAASGSTIITGDFSRISVLRKGKRISVDWATGEILPGDFIEIPRTVYEQVKDVTIFITSLLSIFATTFVIMGYL
ncbi:polysaccharide export protein [Fibrobacteria bacterium R8-3-H12]